MKKVVLILLMVPALAFAQKPIKPNLNKALSAWKAGKFQEAKEIIDVCVTDPKLSLEGNTYYYKGLIYASLDTTSNEAFKKLAENPLQTSTEAFAKADELGKKDKEYFITEATNPLPITKSQQVAVLNGFYLNKGVAAYQADDLESALKFFEKSQLVAKDTSAYFFAAIVTQNLEDYDKAIANITHYMEGGGKSPDAYSWLINIYNTQKKDKNKALELTREAKAKFPNNSDYRRYEISLLIDLGKVAEAKAGLEKAVQDEPNDKILHFYLGYTYMQTGDMLAAKKSFEKSLAIDPQYIDAQNFLAQAMTEDAVKIKKEMNSLGISAADKKRKLELDGVYVQKLKEALPYWEKAEKLDPNNQDILDHLYSIYSDLDMQPQVKRIEKRFKELGIE